MALFLVLQAHYQTYQVGLFLNSTSLKIITDDKKYSSRDLIPVIQTLLTVTQHTLSEIHAFGVNQGPGPFTSLRVLLTTVNGLAFATGIPLIGINSLHALLQEHHDKRWPITVALLNAYNNDLYFAIQAHEGVEIGCKNNRELFALLKKRFSQPIRFLGNGAVLYQTMILEFFGKDAFFPEPFPEEPSLELLGLVTYERYKKNSDLQQQLLPIYLKNLQYKPQI